jgi:hypothetical protein
MFQGNLVESVTWDLQSLASQCPGISPGVNVCIFNLDTLIMVLKIEHENFYSTLLNSILHNLGWDLWLRVWSMLTGTCQLLLFILLYFDTNNSVFIFKHHTCHKSELMGQSQERRKKKIKPWWWVNRITRYKFMTYNSRLYIVDWLKTMINGWL